MPRSAVSEREGPAGSSTARPFECSWTDCSKCFNRKSDLQRHYRIHTNERPYHCTHDGCQKTFIQRSALTVHIRTHTGEKPHKCRHEGCGKKFSDSSSLARHRRIHSGERNYICDAPDCGKEFCRKTTLTKHARKHPHGIDGLLVGSTVNSDDDDEWASEAEEGLPAMHTAISMSRPGSTSYYGDHWRLPTRTLQHMQPLPRFDRPNRPIKLERSISASSHQSRAMVKMEETSHYRYSQATDRILPTIMSVHTSMPPEIHTAPVTSTFPHDINMDTLPSPDALTSSSNGFSNFSTPTSTRSQSTYIGQPDYTAYSLPQALSVNLPSQPDQHGQSPQHSVETVLSPMDHMVSRSASVAEAPNAHTMASQPPHSSVGYTVDHTYLEQDYQEPQLVMSEPMQYHASTAMYAGGYGPVVPTWYTNIKPEETWPGLLPNERLPPFSG